MYLNHSRLQIKSGNDEPESPETLHLDLATAVVDEELGTSTHSVHWTCTFDLCPKNARKVVEFHLNFEVREEGIILGRAKSSVVYAHDTKLPLMKTYL